MSVNELDIGAAYVRVSTDDQTELSPDAQIRVIQEAAKADGFVIPNDFIFVEQRGISGRKADNRPEFQRMIAIAKSQNPAPFKRLYLWKFSRFARNQEESTFYKGILRKKCCVDIKSVSEPIAEGMFGRLIETIIEWFDEYYSFNLSGEVLRGMTEKALREGYQSSPSLGYKAVGDGKPYIIDPEKMSIAEFIFSSYHDGLDMTAIAREANRRGYRTNRNNLLERRTVQRILCNQFYVGTVTWNGISFQGSHEISPVIQPLFADCQERIKREFRPIRRRDVSSGKHWLSGLLNCGACDATLSYNKSPAGDFFQCWKYSKGYHTGSNMISVKKAEAAVLSSLKQVLDSREVDYEYVEPAINKTSTEENLLEESLKRVNYKEQRVHDAYESGVDTIEEYKVNKERLRLERERLLAEIDQLRSAFKTTHEGRPSKEVVLERVQGIYKLLNDPDVSYEMKGNAIRQIVKKIVFNRATGEFKFFYYA